MSSIVSITLKNGTATDVVFTPNGRVATSEQVRYRNLQDPVKGSAIITTLISSKENVDRVTGRITVPKYCVPTEGACTPPELQYTCVGSFDLSLPTAATAADRKDIRVLLSNLLLNAQVVAMSDLGEHQWS